MAHCVCLHIVADAGGDAAGGHVVALVADEFGDFVLVVGGVQAQFPEPILLLQRLPGERHFDTLVGERTDVARHLVAEVGAGLNVDGVEQVGGLAIVVVHATREALVEEAEVETHIISGGRFPGQFTVVGVGAVDVALANQGIIGSIHLIGVVGRKVVVVTDTFLLTGLTITQTEFEVAEGFIVFEERFVLDFPTQCKRGEERPVFLKAARSVVAESGGEEVAVEEAVVGTSEEGDEIVFVFFVLFFNVGTIAGFSRCHTSLGSRVIAGLVETRTIFLGVTMEVLPLITCHDVKVVGLVEILEVLGVGVEGEVVFVDLFPTLPAIVDGFGAGCVGPSVLSAGRIIGAQVHVEAEVFKPVHLVVEFEVAHCRARVGAVVLEVEE